METIELKTEKLNEVEETVFTTHDVNVVLSYWWDSHGRRVEWNGPNGEFREEFHADFVRIVYKEWDLKIYENTYHETCSEAIIDGIAVKALDVDYRLIEDTIYIEAIVGAG